MKRKEPPKGSEWIWESPVHRFFGVYYNFKVKRHGFHFKFIGFQWSQYPYYGWFIRIGPFEFAGAFH